MPFGCGDGNCIDDITRRKAKIRKGILNLPGNLHTERYTNVKICTLNTKLNACMHSKYYAFCHRKNEKKKLQNFISFS